MQPKDITIDWAEYYTFEKHIIVKLFIRLVTVVTLERKTVQQTETFEKD